MFLEGEGPVQGHSEVDRETVIFEDLSVPAYVELSLGLMVIKVKSTDLGFTWVGVQGVLIVEVGEFVQSLGESSFNGFEVACLGSQTQVICVD